VTPLRKRGKFSYEKVQRRPIFLVRGFDRRDFSTLFSPFPPSITVQRAIIEASRTSSSVIKSFRPLSADILAVMMAAEIAHFTPDLRLGRACQGSIIIADVVVVVAAVVMATFPPFYIFLFTL